MWISSANMNRCILCRKAFRCKKHRQLSRSGYCFKWHIHSKANNDKPPEHCDLSGLRPYYTWSAWPAFFLWASYDAFVGFTHHGADARTRKMYFSIYLLQAQGQTFPVWLRGSPEATVTRRWRTCIAFNAFYGYKLLWYQMVLALRSLLSERGGAEQWISIFLKNKRMQNVSLDEMSWGLKIPMSSSAGFFLWTIICHWAWDVISLVLKFLCVFQSGTVWVSYSHTPVTTHHRLSFLSICADCLRWPTMGYQIFWRTHEVIGDIYTLQHIITEEAQSECARFVFCTSLDI